MTINQLIDCNLDELLNDDFMNDKECQRLSMEIAVARDGLEHALECPEQLEGYTDLLYQRAAKMIRMAYMRGKMDVAEMFFGEYGNGKREGKEWWQE